MAREKQGQSGIWGKKGAHSRRWRGGSVPGPPAESLIGASPKKLFEIEIRLPATRRSLCPQLLLTGERKK
ncbi:hypothetical protein MTO96_047192, partial [Rhipicephalus appendiculatus]